MNPSHGNAVGSKLNGATVGLCTNAQVIVVRSISGLSLPENARFNQIHERGLLVPLMTILRDVEEHPERARRTIVNLSLGYMKSVADALPPGHIATIRKPTHTFAPVKRSGGTLISPKRL
jgi:hypothetical protein